LVVQQAVVAWKDIEDALPLSAGSARKMASCPDHAVAYVKKLQWRRNTDGCLAGEKATVVP
jgi:hypothetical protein